jgi:serine/threonine-protein kinase
MFVGGVTAGIWGIVPLAAQRLFDAPSRDSHLTNLSMSAAALVMGVALFVWARDSLTKTVINRRLSACVGMLLLSQVILSFGTMVLGLQAHVADVLFFFLWFFACSYIAITIDRRLAPAALVHLVCFFLAVRFVEQRFYLMAVANLATAVNIVAIWRPEHIFEPKAPRDPTATPERAPRA